MLYTHEAKSWTSKPSAKLNQSFGKIHIHFVANKNAHNNNSAIKSPRPTAVNTVNNTPYRWHYKHFRCGSSKKDNKTMYYNGIEVRSCNHCCSGKAISITYCVVYVSGMQCAYVVLLSVACLGVQYFSTLSHKRKDFRGKKLLNTKCMFCFSLQLSSETFLILRKTETYDQKYTGVPVKWLLFSSNFNVTRIFSAGFRKILRYKIS